MMNGLEKSDPRRSSDEACEQGRATGCAVGGAKGGGRGKRGPITYATDAEPQSRVTGTGPCTASRKAAAEGEVHHAAAPCHHRLTEGRVPGAQAPYRSRSRWLRAVVTGYFAYHAVPTNSRALGAFRHHVVDLWRRSLRRRSQKDGMKWERMTKIAADWLPPPRIQHPWPDRRFAVKHPRWEPSA